MMQKKDYVEYDPETIAKLQRTLLMMLEDFISTCEENNIEYFAIGGTAIGALRHNGMIPWDDDIDIAYLREDEEKIIRGIKEKFGDKYWFANPELEKGFPYIPTHMCLTGTVFKEKNFDEDYNNGVFLDLYPYDKIFEDEKKQKRQVLRAWFYGKLYVLYFASSPILFISGIKAFFVKAICKVVNKFMHLLKVDPQALYAKAMHYGCACEKESASFNTITWLYDTDPYCGALKMDEVFPTRFAKFGDIEIRIPRDTDKYLTSVYGDYMTIPPAEKRHNHPPEILKL